MYFRGFDCTVETVMCYPSRDLNEKVTYDRGLLIQSQYNDQSEKICTSSHHYQNPKNINACFQYMYAVNRYQYKLNLSNNYYHKIFLAHLSQRLKWAIVIARRPSVRRLRPSINFHIFNFFSRTTWWILMTLGRDEVLMVPYKCCCFSARTTLGRIQVRAKIGHGGSPSIRNFFFRPEGYSDKANA